MKEQSEGNQQVNGLEPLIPATTAARVAGISARMLKKYAERGELPATMIGNRWMFRKSLLDKWLVERLMSRCSLSQ